MIPKTEENLGSRTQLGGKKATTYSKRLSVQNTQVPRSQQEDILMIKKAVNMNTCKDAILLMSVKKSENRPLVYYWYDYNL